MDRESPPEPHREIQRDTLLVLQDLELTEGADDGGQGWRVTVVEHLRLQVPANTRHAWVQAELQIWDPWLRSQKGFLGREVLWDTEHQEGVLLIHWASREDWKAIPVAEVAAIQEAFEAVARELLNHPPHMENPFPLVYAGEIAPA